MSLADEVRTVRQRVVARLGELEPLVREYEELRMLAAELGIEAPERGVEGRGRRGVGPEPGSEAPVPGGGPAGERAAAARDRGNVVAVDRPSASRRTDEPDRDARLLGAVRSSPGATTAELATMLGVPATSLYRPVRELTNSGALVKRGRGLYVAES